MKKKNSPHTLALSEVLRISTQNFGTSYGVGLWTLLRRSSKIWTECPLVSPWLLRRRSKTRYAVATVCNLNIQAKNLHAVISNTKM